MGKLKYTVAAILVLARSTLQEERLFDSVGGLVDVYTTLSDLIASVEALDARKQLGRVAYPLARPRADPGLTRKDLQSKLLHSMLSICKPEEVASGKCFCAGMFERAAVFRNETVEAQAVVAVDPRSRLIVLSYRPTTTKRNFDSDLDNEFVGYPGLDASVQVHRGNWEYFRSIHHQTVPYALALLRHPSYAGYTLHLTGYSLGGPVAVLALPAWTRLLHAHRLGNRVQVFNYAGPRAGNMAFARHIESLDARVVRYVKRGDVIPLTPDQSFGFHHAGQEFYDTSIPLLRTKVRRCAPHLVEDPTCSLGGSSFFVISHFTPFNVPLRMPPFCQS